MKIPNWFHTRPTFVCHPAATLQSAAKVLRADAKLHRAYGNREAAMALTRAANSFEEVAQGKTWAQAFSMEHFKEQVKE